MHQLIHSFGNHPQFYVQVLLFAVVLLFPFNPRQWYFKDDTIFFEVFILILEKHCKTAFLTSLDHSLHCFLKDAGLEKHFENFFVLVVIFLNLFSPSLFLKLKIVFLSILTFWLFIFKFKIKELWSLWINDCCFFE